MVRTLLLAPLLLSAACADATGGPGGKAQVAQAAPIAAIAFRISSWGRPIDSWEVRADRSVRHVTMVSDEGAPFQTYRLEHRQFTITADDFARIVAMAGELPQPRLSRDECELRATDMPYGALELERGGEREEITFDVGCRDERYQVFVGQLQAMDELVTGWAQAHAPARIEQVGGG